MTNAERIRWTQEEDNRLINIIKKHLSKGNDISIACNEAGKILSRSTVGCKRRYDKLLENGKIEKVFTINYKALGDNSKKNIEGILDLLLIESENLSKLIEDELDVQLKSDFKLELLKFTSELLKKYNKVK